MAQLLGVVLLLGALLRARGAATASAAAGPVEIPYSQFMDLVELQPKVCKLIKTNNHKQNQLFDGNIFTHSKKSPTRSSSFLQKKPKTASTTTSSSSVASDSTTAAPKQQPSSPYNYLILGTRISPQRIQIQIPKPLLTQQQQNALQLYITEGTIPSVPIPTKSLVTRHIPATPYLLSHLRNNNIPFSTFVEPSKPSDFVHTAIQTCLICFYAFFLLRIYRTFTGGGNGPGGAGGTASPAKLVSSQAWSDADKVTFSDVQGLSRDVKLQVMEWVDILQNPLKYRPWGIRPPRGLLLEGPPGTGKTLLARATACTAGVPMLSCSGSDFVELYVGRGAARVRSLFERAKALAPCIVFIDELDALGKARDNFPIGDTGIRSSNSEQEQTLNQLLACMDGMDTSNNNGNNNSNGNDKNINNSDKYICVMGATNRRQVLDPALLRPGRFDRILRLELPDIEGREAILRVHAQKLPLFREGRGVDENVPKSLGIGNKVDLSAVAEATPGLSGAELEMIVNEAAIRAVRRVTMGIRQEQLQLQAAGENYTMLSPTLLSNPPALQQRQQAVLPEDFQEAIQDFFASRRKNMGVNLGSLFGKS